MVGGVVSSVRRGDGGGAVGITEPNQHADLNTDGGGTGDDDVLTTRQRAILDVIISHVNERGFPPSMREIGETVGLRSPASVKFHLDNLQNAGYLKRDPVKPRSIQVNYGGVPTTDTSNGVSCRDSDESWSLGRSLQRIDSYIDGITKSCRTTNETERYRRAIHAEINHIVDMTASRSCPDTASKKLENTVRVAATKDSNACISHM